MLPHLLRSWRLWLVCLWLGLTTSVASQVTVTPTASTAAAAAMTVALNTWSATQTFSVGDGAGLAVDVISTDTDDTVLRIRPMGSATTNALGINNTADSATIHYFRGDGTVMLGEVNNAAVTIGSRLVTKVDARTIADSGDANPATLTLTPTTSYVEITCNDANGCTITMGETAVLEGTLATIINLSTNTIGFSDTAGVSELAGAFAAAGQYDLLTLVYIGDRWVETGRSDN